MAKISKEKQPPVAQKVLHELFDYDEETGGWTNKTNRSPNARKGQPSGSLDTSTGYVRICVKGHYYKAHRLAWVYIHGDYPDGEQPYIDHINGKKADNRIVNLKVSTPAENSRNKKIPSNNTSGVNGVYRDKKVNPVGKIYFYWVAHWYDEKGKPSKKSFPILTIGEAEAKQMAINYRVEQIRLLELNHGIVYSERHGT